MQRSLVGLLLALALLAGCSRSSAPPDPAVFVVDVVGERFRIRLDDPARIREARRLLRTRESRIVTGKLAAGDGGFNAGYSWHLEPGTVEFVEVAIELCDGRPSFVEAELDYWLGTVGRYCPWGSQLVDEL